MKKRNIDLSGPEGNVFAVLAITYQIVKEAQGEKEAKELRNKVLRGAIKTYDEVLTYCAEKAKGCGVELVYENRYKL